MVQLKENGRSVVKKNRTLPCGRSSPMATQTLALKPGRGEVVRHHIRVAFKRHLLLKSYFQHQTTAWPIIVWLSLLPCQKQPVQQAIPVLHNHRINAADG
jgi:hypothetical protein